MIFIILFAICVCLSPLTVLRGETSLSAIDIGLVASAVFSVFYLNAQTLVSDKGAIRDRKLSLALPVGTTSINPIARFCFVSSLVLIASSLVNMQYRSVSDGSIFVALTPFVATFFVVFVICMILHSRFAVLFIFSFLLTAIGLSLLYNTAAILGVSSYYYESRFSGLSINPNQTAMHALSIIVTALAVLFKFELNHWPIRLLAMVAIPAAVFFGFYTNSDAFIIALLPIAGAVALVISRRLFVTLKNAILIGIFLTALAATIMALLFPVRIASALDLFLSGLQTGNQDSDREILWRHGIQAWEASPFIGNGPGAWSGLAMPFQGMESHNSYIDWLTIAGLAGFIPFALSIGSTFRLNFVKHLTSYLAILAILTFASFHFMFRLPIFWLPIILLQAEHISSFGLSLPRRGGATTTATRPPRGTARSV